MRSADLLLKEAENTYEQVKQETTNNQLKPLAQFGKYVLTLATDLNLDAFVLQRKHYQHIFN